MNRPEPLDDEHVIGSEVARTDLAWSRSGLALTVAAAAILKVVVHVSDYRESVVILVGLAAIGIVWAFMFAHGRVVAADTIEGRLHHSQRKLRFVALVTVAFSVTALVISFLPQQ